MNTLAGLRTPLCLGLRRDWLFWLCWMVGLALLPAFTATSYDQLIPPGTDPSATIEPLRNSPAMLALLGPAFDLYSKGGFVMWRVGGFTSVFVGMAAGFGVIRATRAEEEAGRLELIRSGSLGRHAPLGAAIVLATIGSLGTGLLTGVLTVAVGLPATGSVAAGLAMASTGLVFTGIGAVVAQVFESARTARYWTIGAIWGGMFVLRMMVDGAGPDAGISFARWLIPLEWGMLIRPWADERWWVFLLSVALFAVLVLLAFRLESTRDHGAGLTRTRPGRPSAAAWLAGPFGLAWRLQRGGLVGWSLGLLLGAVGTGSIMSQMDQSIEANPEIGAMLEKMGGTSNVEMAFYIAMLDIMATVAGIMGATILHRLRAEEARGHAEALLATAVPRWRLALSHLAWAVVLPCLVFIGVGALLPLVQAGSSGDYSAIGQYTRAAAALTPGIVFVVGLAMLLIGWFPRLTGLVWAVLGWTMFATWFAVLFQVPEWLTKVQPWGYLAHLPRDAMDWPAFAVESVIGVALLVAGLVGYRHRSIPA
ncbi:ABC transporter membrane-spanning protein [Brooklawnia cerclae]|uniref:ABC-2 type transport system permease protein n=1 Tax=Brooklawnia cerclae TaxID=349934 RepID=A0ABX0SHL2_9ACTN|nr:hypothetical protein [Brooklawnia cerclae]NIH57890.1 ABC-2 type transport system permease protein [Brooklawnia cerclae]